MSLSTNEIQESDAQREVGTRRRVLIIDDDAAFTLLAGETIQQAGFDVSIASNSREALAAFDACRPDLVLLDVELPGSNGFDLCATLRAMSPGIDVPIVMVTGHDDTASIAQAYRVGATDFIHKPVLWGTLPHRISFILRAQDNLRALQLSEQKNRALLQALPDTIYIVDGRGVLLEHITGDDKRNGLSLIGKQLEHVLPPDVARAARASAGAASPTAPSTFEFVVGRGKDQKAFEARLRPQPDGTLLIVMRDTTERRRAKARIEYLAYYDVLTGLPNRQLFVREVGRAISAAKESGRLIALLYLDLDRFKRINDNLGHAVGDVLLQNVARRLEQSVKPPETGTSTTATSETRRLEQVRIARLGGDEFVVLLTGLSEEGQILTVVERIRQTLSEPIECGRHRLIVTPSIGIALYPRDASDIEDLIVKADMAMYQAKDQGRNGHSFFGHSMAVRSLGRLELETDLRSAFEHGDFSIFYQPKVDLATSEIIGVEALLRWHHAERGWIAPQVFIPVAEETGLIGELGDWVIHEACKQLAIWKRSGLGYLTVAVNVSVQQFAHSGFVDSVLRALQQHGVKPQRLELEITESLLMRDIDNTTASMKRFREAGVTLSIDDFGTGYSSLGYLRQFPVDALKIDRSFVKDLHTNDDDAAICAAIIAMARELKLKVIAEGVANAEQMKFLRRHRCDQVQGYLISKPVPVEDLEMLLRGAAPGASEYDHTARHHALRLDP
jgi:predicted signal transduction protein with EAL and GGDEF domain/FixJ family two-component response regulator